METIDVTKIEPRLKHPTIFDRFDTLAGGESFIIHNDHDPKPLYYQLIAERGEIFDWEYLIEGPSIWEVKISKQQGTALTLTIGELVAKDFRKAAIFRSFGLDFCCGGNKSLQQACEEKGIDSNAVSSALTKVDNDKAYGHHDFNNWELDFLVDYIINTHHKYVAEAIPMLYEFSSKVANVHGDAHPEVVEIAQLFDAVAQELKMHMLKEEQILFPYIKEMHMAKRAKTSLEPAPFGSIENPIRMMESEHISAGGNIEQINKLTKGFMPPEDACTTYRVLYQKLEEFERDLHQHIHLENNILFPKAIELERELIN